MKTMYWVNKTQDAWFILTEEIFRNFLTKAINKIISFQKNEVSITGYSCEIKAE